MAVARPTAPPVEPDAVCAPALPLQPKVWSGGRRWAVLLSFSLLSASNAFLLMDFADDYTLSESMLGVDAASVAFLYSLFLLCVMPAMLVAAWAVVHHSAPAVAVAALLNAAAAWLRYAAVLRRSYPLAVASTVLAGFAAAVVVCSYAVIAERWFRPTQRGLATSVAVQSNYFGWAAGSLIGLAEAGDPHKARQLLLGQAIALSCSVPLILLCYRGEAPGVGHAVSDRQAVYESAGQTVNVNNGQAVNANARQAVNANDVPAVNGNARQAVNVNARQAVNPAPVHGRFVAAAAANPTAPTASPANHAPNSPVPVRAVPATSPARRAANPRPTAAPSATAPSQPSPPAPPLGALASARTLGRNRRYWVYAIPYSIIGGVGFAIPSAQDVLLGSSCYPHTSTGAAWHGFDTPHTSFTNLSFILTGVTVGLVAGAAASPAAREGLVLFLALLGALALSLLSFIAEPHTAASMPPEELYPALLVLMSAAGASTVGFIGPALSFSVSLGSPVPEAYSVGGLEWLIQGVGGALATFSASCLVGFRLCVILQWVATLALGLAYALGRRDDASREEGETADGDVGDGAEASTGGRAGAAAGEGGRGGSRGTAHGAALALRVHGAGSRRPEVGRAPTGHSWLGSDWALWFDRRRSTRLLPASPV